MGRVIYIDDNEKEYILQTDVASLPLMIKLWSLEDIQNIAAYYNYNLSDDDVCALLADSKLSATIFETSDDERRAFADAIERLGIVEADEDVQALAKLGLRFAECRDCEFFDTFSNYCMRDHEFADARDSAVDCLWYRNNALGQETMLYYGSDDHHCAELPLIPISGSKTVLDNNDAVKISDILRKIPKYRDEIERLFGDGKEDQSQWRAEVLC